MPRVSICIPTYNPGALLGATLDSVWAQTYTDFEVILVDDGSTDDTDALLAAQSDPRLKVWRHSVNQGQAQTVDDTMRYAGGELIKFLDHDDLLHPDCLDKMVAALDRHPSASFVFSRRKILVDDPHDPGVRFWLTHNEELQRHFGELAEVNDGAAMLRAWVDEGMASNWIAEPAGVMTRRSCIDRIGGRSRRVRFITDMEFWGRMMTCGDVVFLDEALYTYRFALTGLTGAAVGSDRHWLDPLWGAVGILPLTRGEAERATVRRMRYLLARRAWRRALTHLVTAKPGAVRKIGDLLVYTGFRARAMVGLAPPLYPEVRFTPHSSPD